jgi:hypothetical protein
MINSIFKNKASILKSTLYTNIQSKYNYTIIDKVKINTYRQIFFLLYMHKI